MMLCSSFKAVETTIPYTTECQVKENVLLKNINLIAAKCTQQLVKFFMVPCSSFEAAETTIPCTTECQIKKNASKSELKAQSKILKNTLNNFK